MMTDPTAGWLYHASNLDTMAAELCLCGAKGQLLAEFSGKGLKKQLPEGLAPG